MKYLAEIQGGVGPDVWEREIPISGCDFLDAARQAQHQADEMGGHVTNLSFSGYETERAGVPT